MGKKKRKLKKKIKPSGRKAPAPLPADRFDPEVFRKRRACVLGLGRSGFHAAALLSRKGFKVLVSDSRSRKELPFARRLPKGIVLEAGGHGDKALTCGFALKSPGILPQAPILGRIREAGIPIFSELEVSLAFCRSSEIIAVTGTNGKTTTTFMASAILKAAGRRVHTLGNVGTPLSAEAAKVGKGDVLVLEASSYQLEDSRCFKPAAAAVLNVTSDHLDHHGSMAAYLAAKARVFRDMSPSACCVFNAADPLAFGLSRDCAAKKLFFSLRPSTLASAWFERGSLRFSPPFLKKGFSVAPPKLVGEHNLENAMAAGLLALACGAPPKALARAFKAFRGVEHRIEECGKFHGLRCVNDSKATNVDSTLVALKSLEDQAGKILLILGGLAKPGGFAPLRAHVQRCAKAVLTIGSAAAKIEEDLAGAAPVFPCESLAQAVSVAFRIGQAGETLLLSPACASMDQFRDFEHRGQAFKELLRKTR
ncbi:MAG: UDP-N-acetylmuramoyl-L-alanine--D-glutamate ligase [Elusimicrobia bacterium]|nr:UDP-N-acetylmuramoyl-L-alanine--D-glutamate ligase [Elusimicrobiota bacterium]